MRGAVLGVCLMVVAFDGSAEERSVSVRRNLVSWTRSLEAWDHHFDRRCWFLLRWWKEVRIDWRGVRVWRVVLMVWRLKEGGGEVGDIFFWFG